MITLDQGTALLELGVQQSLGHEPRQLHRVFLQQSLLLLLDDVLVGLVVLLEVLLECLVIEPLLLEQGLSLYPLLFYLDI